MQALSRNSRFLSAVQINSSHKSSPRRILPYGLQLTGPKLQNKKKKVSCLEFFRTSLKVQRISKSRKKYWWFSRYCRKTWFFVWTITHPCINPIHPSSQIGCARDLAAGVRYIYTLSMYPIGINIIDGYFGYQKWKTKKKSPTCANL